MYSLNDKCGIFAIYDENDISTKLINGLDMLQHRGRESCGISYIDNNKIETYKNLGLIKDVFINLKFKKDFKIGIGHVRYSTRIKTTLSNKLIETQPIEGKYFSIAHNGNIPNIEKIKNKYQIDYQTESDTIILSKIIEKLKNKYNKWSDVFIELLQNIKGVYCLLILTNNKIFAIRDSYGIRPLSIGKNNTGYCITSESCALQNYQLMRDVEPGEIVKIYKDNNKICLKSIYTFQTSQKMFCSFEYIYFMRNNSINNQKLVENIRYQLGYKLGENEINIDRQAIVISIPNTAIPSGKGFASAINLKYYDYIRKNINALRTFILPTNEERRKACDNKFLYDTLLNNKNVYVVDDSLVRGNTLKSVIKNLKNIGVKNIHLRITSPPVISQCYYGIDIPTKEELIAHNKSIESIREELNVTSLKYLDINDMLKILNTNDENVCTHCFDANYNKDILNW